MYICIFDICREKWKRFWKDEHDWKHDWKHDLEDDWKHNFEDDWKHDVEHDLEHDLGAIGERVVVFSNAYRFSKILHDVIGTSGGHSPSFGWFN